MSDLGRIIRSVQRSSPTTRKAVTKISRKLPKKSNGGGSSSSKGSAPTQSTKQDTTPEQQKISRLKTVQSGVDVLRLKAEAAIEWMEHALQEPTVLPEQRGVWGATGGIRLFKYDGMSAPVAAETVLREHGKPLHLRKIIDKMYNGGYSEQPDPKKLYNNLYTTMKLRKKKVFKMVKPAVFALVEWG